MKEFIRYYISSRVATIAVVVKGGYSTIYRAVSQAEDYWSNRTKPKLDPMINWETGQTWEQFTELHHRFVPQRWKWAPNWLKNNDWNLKPLSSLEHSKVDPHRARRAPKWVKDLYNLKWK